MFIAGVASSLEIADVRAQSESDFVAPRVEVIGTRVKLPEISGTATTLLPQELEAANVFTTTEALRKAPGVYVRDEEGFGLRPNIGIRGLNPTRSTKVLLLEDGIPLAYGPYGDNASYYHPPIDRFERIEVLKGAEQVRFGPQTAGGVVNYITPLPGGGNASRIGLTGGNRGYFNAHARLSQGPVLVDYVRKQGDGSRDNTHSAINDFNFKALLDLSDGQALALRANVYTEDSQVSYTGLTQAEYQNFGATYNPFDNDTFDAHRIGLSATHEAQLSEDVSLLTNLYGSFFKRDWWRQSSTTTDTQCGNPFRDARLAGSRVNPDTCNSTQGRLRQYYTFGLEPRLTVRHASFGVDNELEAGVRAHYEIQERRQENGTAPAARSGTTAENNERFVDAYSAYMQNRFKFGDWTVTPGARLEHMRFERRNNLSGARGGETLTELLPALGGTYALSGVTTLYAGVHRGFSPPRVEDLINNSGVTAAEVPIDDAIETELGIRSNPIEGVRIDAALFRNDFDQQVVVGSVAGGNLPLAVGETTYEGVELYGRVDLAKAGGMDLPVSVRLAYQWLWEAEVRSTFRPIDPAATAFANAIGNRLPYAPEHVVTLGVGLNPIQGFGGELEMVYTSTQFTDFANTTAPTANGLAGVIDSYTLWNLSLNYSPPGTRWTGFFTVKNLLDEEYIADRTRGVLPGIQRLFQAGLKYAF